MPACTPEIPTYISEKGDIAVIEKYQALMQATLGEDSLYERAKSTYFELFKDMQISEAEKANIVAQNITAMTTQMSASAMSAALSWGKEERDGAYALAKMKADTQLALVSIVKTTAEICDVEASTELKCAQITATLSGSIRDNGSVLAYDVDGCKPLTLNPEGLKFEQTKMVSSQTYQILSDAFRKSGVIVTGEDEDGFVKGLAAKINSLDGHTFAQTEFTKRQTLSFEDSKKNHAANAASQMIGQLLASETFSDANAEDIERWRAALDYLLGCTPEVCTPTVP